MSNWIDEIKNVPHFTKFAQHGEEPIILHIFDNIGEGTKFFCDLGANCYGGMVSNTKYLQRERGWTGLRFDATDENDDDIIKAWIEPENIVSLLKEHGCPREFDFLSIDIDSFDYDVAESVLQEFSPRMMCLEYNPSLPVQSEVKLAFEKNYYWDSTNKYGFSFGAGVKLGKKYGYELIFNHIGQNLFYVRKDIVKGMEIPEIKAVQKVDHPINNDAIWVHA